MAVRARDGKVLLDVSDTPDIVKQFEGELEKLTGDGLAQVERAREAGFSLAFGRVRITSFCGITLTCNQDIATIEQAKRIGAHIVDTTVFTTDQELMQKFLEHYNDSEGT